MRHSKLLRQNGFTLIELLVVMAIFVIITGIVLARQNRFSSDILLTDLAYQVAGTIRQAQIYGLGVAGATVNTYDTGYGVDFNVHTPSSYLFFADVNKNGICDIICSNSQGGFGSDQLITNFQIQKGGTISAVCGIEQGTGTTYCWGNQKPYIDIVYLRPNPSAILTGPGQGNQLRSYSQITITILSSLGDRAKCVRVDQNGQVSVLSQDSTRPGKCPGQL